MTARFYQLPQGNTVPVLVVCGIDEPAMMATSMSLQFGLPNAVAVRHTINLQRQQLTRTVSDVMGVLEYEQIDLAHTCVSCAIREDIVPTLERLAALDRWDAIIACLPVAAEAVQVCRVLGNTPRAVRRVDISAVVTALDGTTVSEDLLGEELLCERGLATFEGDERGVAEVACAMVEYADVVSLSETPSSQENALVAALARPRVPMIDDPALLNAVALATGVHRHQVTEDWVAEVRRGELPDMADSGVWRLDLRSDRPFHPVRIHDELMILGGGPRRSRGCFWLPTRPQDICVWDGAGGQTSVGALEQWAHGQTPLTRLVIVGLADSAGDCQEIEAAFHRCLLTDEELASRGQIWEESFDGLEPWLGPINRAA
ncbi:GTPase, G3E family [Micrococcales bacterium KH10]|nr:GTPase, G3E family [Micrococcales bacterium KH10]